MYIFEESIRHYAINYKGQGRKEGDIPTRSWRKLYARCTREHGALLWRPLRWGSVTKSHLQRFLVLLPMHFILCFNFFNIITAGFLLVYMAGKVVKSRYLQFIYPLQHQGPQSRWSVREHRFQIYACIYIEFNYQLYHHHAF